MVAWLSDQLEYTNQFGEVLTKAQWLNNIGTEKLRHISFDHKVADLQIYGDAAVLTGVSHTVRSASSISAFASGGQEVRCPCFGDGPAVDELPTQKA
jgi:hypothetical protein